MTDNAPGEIITHSLPSYNEKKNDAQGLELEDMADLPFGNDAGEDRSSNQTGGLFTRRNKIIVGSGIGGILLVAATGLSSSSLTNNNMVESFNVQSNANVGIFSLIETYEFPDGELGGGSIVNDKLFLIVEAFDDDAYIASVPILRNSTTGRITGFNFEALQQVHTEPEMEMLSQKANFVGNKYVYTTDDADTMSFADKDFTDISKIENIPSLDIRDSATGVRFYGPEGVDLSPVITDPETGVGKLMCTSDDEFWEVALQLNNSATPSKWEISSATLLAIDFSDNNGGFSFIPSGSYKNDIVFADYDDDSVKMMKFDDNGRPVVQGGADLDTALKAAEITELIEDRIDYPWGVFFDPKTNDLFVTTYDYSEIVQIIGFPPGLDVEVVTANIQNETEVALEILLGGRRKLQADQQPTLDVKNNNRALETKAAKTKAAKGKTGPVEVEIPPSDEIAAEILNAATPEEAAGKIGGLLDTTFRNDSFTQTILSGGVSEVFDANIAKVSDAINLLSEAANSAGLEADELNQVQASLNTVKQLLELLANVGEGSG